MATERQEDLAPDQMRPVGHGMQVVVLSEVAQSQVLSSGDRQSPKDAGQRQQA